MVNTVFDAIGSLWTAVLTWFVNGFQSVVSLFYDASANEFTLVGVIMLISTAIAVFTLVLRYVIDLLHVGRT